MLETLKIETLEETIDYNKLYDDAFVDVTKQLEKQPIALSMGKKFGEFTPIVTYGNFMCLVGASKSMKTFLKTALTASYVGGEASKYFSETYGHENSGKYVLDFDTEQSEYHVQLAARRVVKMVGKQNPFYKPFALRPFTVKERVDFIEHLIMESDFKNKVGLVLIDGIADLVDNVNDLDKSNAIVQKMMTITEQSKCAMITVLHRNFDSDKPTGHLGSAVLKKSETVLFVNKQGDIVDVKSQYSRNIPIDDFSFTVVDGIPQKTDNNIF